MLAVNLVFILFILRKSVDYSINLS